MQKVTKILSLIMGMALLIGMLAACGKEKDTPTPEPTNETKKQITITFRNGATELGKISIDPETAVTDYEKFENQEGFEFLGWYETPSYVEASKKDLSKDTFKYNTVLYGNFKSTEVTQDTRSWYIVGDGSGSVLKSSAWAGGDVNDDAKKACQFTLKDEKKNIFTIDIDLFEGDLFQIVNNWQWDGQVGYGFLKGVDESLMISGGGLDGSAKKSNTKVVKDGNYTITLITDVDDANRTEVTVVRNGDPKTEAQKWTPSEKSGVAVKGSWVADWSEIKMFERKEGNKFTLTMTVEAGTEFYIMAYDDGKDTGIGMKYAAVKDEASKALLEEADNIKVKDAGTYTFTVDLDTLEVTVTK